MNQREIIAMLIRDKESLTESNRILSARLEEALRKIDSLVQEVSSLREAIVAKADGSPSDKDVV